MKYNVFDFLRGIQIKSNPNALRDALLVILIIVAFFSLGFMIVNISKFKRKILDKKLYNFLFEFNGITEEEKIIINNMIKKYKIRPKYNILILESVFEKHLEYEIMKIEQSNILSSEKEKKIDKYLELKKKIFYSDIIERVEL
ncbi:hypothetical protein [Haliovirga abyssi]|uniref:Uncharacterized protein n=1 Tax=Haliovirga abyssi TaxID=2996794 RepID=A0AAU9DMB2_9FUSO|nr:hypothetical protein [Haliovirga abyssi]BDU51147.1 hypothetical protein HLVA_17160 [Haliovirga abyssi]